MAAKRRCEAKRRMWRGSHLGDFKCGRVARYTFQTYVGLCRTHYVCGEDACMRALTGGYPANNVRAIPVQSRKAVI
jgi:hypothetical protein